MKSCSKISFFDENKFTFRWNQHFWGIPDCFHLLVAPYVRLQNQLKMNNPPPLLANRQDILVLKYTLLWTTNYILLIKYFFVEYIHANNQNALIMSKN